ncbi:hypothetical protein SNEBB_003193 [Seison nebaliae]|nr:hypothetical protein SNEBB_003193 [Seison nebaliae]
MDNVTENGVVTEEIEIISNLYTPREFQRKEWNVIHMILSREYARVRLTLTYPDKYPNEPISFNLKLRPTNALDIDDLYSALRKFLQHDTMINGIDLIVELRNTLQTVKLRELESRNDERIDDKEINFDEEERTVEDEIKIISDESITDRRSTFQAHFAVVKSVDDVKRMKKKLMENNKVVGATHNILAYIIEEEGKESLLMDSDNDGETHAGDRMLHMMKLMKVKNCCVIVSRWYGGIKLGADRFKRINDCCKSILLKHFIKNEQK